MASIPASPSPASAEPMLIPQGDYAGKPPLRLQKSVVVVGADEHCHLHLISSSVSRHHALIIHDQDGVYIRDLGSRTKVVVNGQPHRETVLANEDEIHIGKFSFMFSFPAPAVEPAVPVPAIRFMVNGKAAASLTTCRTLLIGKGDGCDISLADDSVSSRHAVIFTAKGKRYVRDLDSRSGTSLDGEKIHQKEIHSGTELRIGESVITVAEIAKPAEVIETPVFESPAIAMETHAEPVVESTVHSGDTLPLPLEPAPEPEQAPTASPEPLAQLPETSEPLKLELEPEIPTGALESALADAEIDLSKDSIPVKKELAQTPDAPEPLKLELEPETKTDALESALADVEIDLSKDAIPVEPGPVQIPAASQEPAAQSSDVPESLKQEIQSDPEVADVESAFADVEIELQKDKDPIPLEPEPEAQAEQAATLDVPDEAAAEIATAEPAGEPAHPEIDLSDTALDLEPEPAVEPAEPAAEVLDLSAATPMPPPIAPLTAPTMAGKEPIDKAASEAAERLPEPGVADIEVPHPPDSPIDLNFDLDLHLDSVEKIEAVEPPSIEQTEPFQPKIELTPMELASDEPQSPPQEDAAGESRIQESTTDVAPPDTSGEPPEKTRKRPARGRKAAPKKETKPAKVPRGKARRRPPQMVELAAPSEPNVESKSDANENRTVEPDLSPSSPDEIPADEISGVFLPDEPAGIAPAISVQPQVPETPPPSGELPTDVWDMSSEAAEGNSALAMSNENGGEPSALRAAMDVPEAPLEANDSTVVDWSVPASVTDEISAPIISEDQTAGGAVLSVEPATPEPPLVGDDLATGDWAVPPAPSVEISAPIISDPRVVETPSAGPPLQPAGVRRPAAAAFEPPFSSIGGFGFVGGGAVNLDHFLGGMPIQLPQLPPAPVGFGKIRIDMSGKPSAVRVTAPLQPPPPQIPPSTPPPPPIPVAASEAFAPQPPPANPIIQPPPVSFVPPPPQNASVAGDVYRPLDQGFPPEQSPSGTPKPSNAFDGLAMGAALDTDIFSDMAANPTPTNDTAFGGPALSRPDDYAIPDSSDRAAKKPEQDLADDDFWNRIDPQDDPASTGQRPETPLPAPSKEELRGLQNELSSEEPGDTQSDDSLPPRPMPESSPPAKRRRFRIPFIMPLVLAGVGVALAAIWRFIPAQSQINGTMTFLDFNFIPGTQDSIDFEAAQRRLLDDQTRTHATEILARDYPGADQGFLKSPELFNQVAASITLSSATPTASPQTLLQLSSTGSDKEGDRLRMLALLQALADRDAPQLDGNRRIRDQLRRAQQNVDDAQQKLDNIKNQLSELTPVIDAAPPVDLVDSLTNKKIAMEQARLDADSAVNRDRADLARFEKPLAADAQPAIADPQLKQMRQRLADLSAEVDSARSDQLAGAAMARQKLQLASRQFDEQIAAANTLLGGESQLRQFVDSAMNSQIKARDLINVLIVDSEDLELQLEDTRRDVEDLIQTQQADKWALDPQMQSLRENLDSAQHRYNANVGQGITDPRILDPLQKEIDNWTSQVKERQAQLGADPGEIRVQESLDSIIDALRKKLAKEKHQTDQVLDPLQQQLADLDPVVAALPAAQQEVARQIHERLDALNDARQKFADSFGDEQLAPSAKVVELKNQIADLKADIAARQADLERDAVAARDAQRSGDLATVQARLQTDQQKFDDASKKLEAGLSDYDDVHAKQVAADAAQQKKINLLDDQRSAFADLETARRDRDEKQSAADHAFDIKPITAADVVAIAPPDPRMMYSLAVMGGGLIAIALTAVFSHGGPRRSPKKSAKPTTAADFDSLVIPMASDDDHPATA
jgi:pSer/pThr/pTyr-binding forkhead associated (FHA) protein